MIEDDNKVESPDSLEDEPAGQMPLKEGIDYYIENGLFVFTSHFLRKRGYCCESGCRHCPYEPEDREKGQL